MTREEYIIELEKQGYEQLREDIFIKNNDIYHLEEFCHCIIDGVRQCDYELKFTRKTTRMLDNSIFEMNCGLFYFNHCLVKNLMV